MLNYIPKLELIEFFKVYPDIIPKIDKDDIHKFSNFFKMQPNQKQEYNKSIRRSQVYTYNKSQGLLNINKKENKKKLNEPRKSTSYNMKIPLKNEIPLNSYNIGLLTQGKDKNIDFNYNQKQIEINNHNKIILKNDDKNSQYIEGKELENYFLLKKGILLQDKRKKRTNDVKKSLELFLFHSYFFEKISRNLNALNTKIKNFKKISSPKEEISSSREIQDKIKNKLNNIIAKLSEKLIINKYPKNKFVVKMNEVGKDCYFLISGKVSVLKPVEYKNMKITYHDYLIYLKCLLNLDEIDLVLKVLSVNKNFLNISNIDKISKLIRAYFIFSLKNQLNKIVGGITIEDIENFFKSYHFSLEEFQLNKNQILKQIKDMEEKPKNADLILLDYINEKIPLTNEDLYLLDSYKLSSLEKKKKYNSVILYKYEIFLSLYPGSFFGDSALEKTVKRRNASIRTEEECFICSLGNEYYSTLLSEENRKIKILDLNFLCNNFFFNRISPFIFNKYYFSKFKAAEKMKNEIIYNQNDNASSVFLIKEGMVKLELFASVMDIFNLIRDLIKMIFLKNKIFKINLEKIMELKNIYLYDKKINKENLFLGVNKKLNIDLYISEGYECLGIQEFFLNLKYITTCTIISKSAILMEIKKEDLSHIINNEKDILPDYYKYIFSKILMLIKRLYYIKKSFINNLDDKYDEKRFNFFSEKEIEKNSNNNSSININIQGTNNHKQKIEVLNNEKAKYICDEKRNSETNIIKIKNNNNSISLTDRNFFSNKMKYLPSKNLSSFRENRIKNITYNKLLNHHKLSSNNENKKSSKSNLFLLKKEIFPIKNNEIMNTTMSFSQNQNNKYIDKLIYKGDNNNSKNKINNEVINTIHGLISLKQYKKNILKRQKEKINLTKLNFIRKFKCFKDEEKFNNCDFSSSYIKNKSEYNILNRLCRIKTNLIKNNKENNISLITKDEIDINNILYEKEDDLENNYNKTNKSALIINSKECINFNKHRKKLTKKEKTKNSLVDIQKKNKILKNLIFDMKKRYAISNGQKKFIYYRKSKKNKAINLIEDRNNYNLDLQKTIGQTIKDYYFKKKIQGYSSLINPKNNTYINRQKTFKITKINE